MKNHNKNGFTLIEVLMVILIVAILALMAIAQFTNFAADAKDSTTKANLQVLRRGISSQNAQMRLRCGVTGTAFPSLASLVANDITTSECTTNQVTVSTDRLFVSAGIPSNPWGSAQANTITASTVVAANRATQACGGGARGAADDGWCYNANTGEIWANSAHNTGAATGGTESGF